LIKNIPAKMPFDPSNCRYVLLVLSPTRSKTNEDNKIEGPPQRAFREALSDSEYEPVLCDVKDKYYKKYNLACGQERGTHDVSS